MQVYIGIDWSKDKHDVAYMNSAGSVIAYQTIASNPVGYAALDARRQQLGAQLEECWVGIETVQNLLLDDLVRRGYSHLYLVPPSLVKDSRGRFGESKANSDRKDAELLADLLRTDRARLHPWQPDSDLMQQLIVQVSLESFLTNTIIRVTNRLRNGLWRYYPNAANVFSSLDTQIALEFICAYPSPEQSQALTFEAFRAFAKQHHYPNPKKLPGCYARLQQPQPEPAPAILLAYQPEAVYLAHLTLQLVQQRVKVQKTIQDLFTQHPDAAIFASLPGAGEKLAPALLTKFGDDRQRFPTPASLQALAGTCPFTKASGKRRRVLFRHACDKEFRTIAQQWAKASINLSPWAIAYFQTVLPRCRSTSQAYRRLANRWLAIAWRLWQDQKTYNETYHLHQHALRAKPV
jgi:transposase